MKRIISSEEGERVVLGAPAPGHVLIKVDARQEPAAWTIALQTLQAGADLPMHRIRDWDQVWFVHKGQGKATVAGTTTTVVPGAIVHVPRQTWFGLRNTGTGILQALIVAAPAGIDSLYRELGSLGAAPDAAVLQQVVERYGLELSAGSAAAAPASGQTGASRARRRGRGRGRSREQAAAATTPATPQASLPPAPAAEAPSGTPAPPVEAPQRRDAVSGDRPGRRRHRRRGGQGRTRGQPVPQTPQGAASAPAATPDSSARKPVRSPAPSAAPQGKPGAPSAGRPGGRSDRQGGRHRGGRRFGRVKEVYMGGRWVRVSGEGPVVSTGHDAVEKPEDDE